MHSFILFGCEDYMLQFLSVDSTCLSVYQDANGCHPLQDGSANASESGTQWGESGEPSATTSAPEAWQAIMAATNANAQMILQLLQERTQGQGNQGNLYLDEKKIAWYNDSGNGGPADIDFYDISGRKENEAKLEEIVKMYYKKYPLEEQYKNLEPDVEMLIGRLIELMDDEKQYKKYAKQGYPVMIAYRKM